MGFDDTFKLAIVKSFQSLRMYANIAEHELRTQKTYFKLRVIAQA